MVRARIAATNAAMPGKGAAGRDSEYGAGSTMVFVAATFRPLLPRNPYPSHQPPATFAVIVLAMRGFILTPTYRIRDGVPEVHLYGVLEAGEARLIIDYALQPHLFT